MTKFGIRQSFDKIEQVEDRYAKMGVPVELALPFYWEIYEPVRAHLGEIAEKIRSYGTEVLSVHAVQATITDERFRAWGKEVAEFAKAVGARTITVHPNNVKKDNAVQGVALKNLEYFTALYKNEIVFSVETFEGNRRVFTPDEITSFDLPMTLDTSHIRDNEKIWSFLKGYKDRITTIHLSARDSARQHLPIDDFCKDLVRYLIDSNWNGNIILEYLFEYHGQMKRDVESLKAMM
jgi:sugar phosphate isomerase/epimerase